MILNKERGKISMNCDMSCKEKFDSALKLIFVVVFTWGVMSAVCCMKSCSASSCASKTGCSKASQVDSVKQCGPTCQKPCCK